MSATYRYSRVPSWVKQWNELSSERKIAIASLSARMRATPGMLDDRTYHLKTYKSCLVANDTVTWAVNNSINGVKTREEAVRMLQELVKFGYLHHVCDDHEFQDAYLYFRFVDLTDITVFKLLQGKKSTAGWVEVQGGFSSKTKYMVLSPEEKAIFEFEKDIGTTPVDSIDLTESPCTVTYGEKQGGDRFELRLEFGGKRSTTMTYVFSRSEDQDIWLQALVNTGASYSEPMIGLAKTAHSVFEFSVLNSYKQNVNLGELFRGKVCLIVNVASKCGLTPSNYTQLQALHAKYSAAGPGLAIIGFPCNQFSSQEPGSNVEIAEFVKKFGVEFPLMDKVCVNGTSTIPLFSFLKARTQGTFGSFIKWNFTKFLCDIDGKPFKRYGPAEMPMSLEPDIRKLLGLPPLSAAEARAPAAGPEPSSYETTMVI
eukprot:m.214241 g.214241  ORF g.214241 m.214241 type:complete len:427 (-) comp33384_c0_seq1:218-1498(-)